MHKQTTMTTGRASGGLRRGVTAAQWRCPSAGTRAEPAKPRPLAAERPTARGLERAALWGAAPHPASSPASARSGRATGLGAARRCQAGPERAAPAGLDGGAWGAACPGLVGRSAALWSAPPPPLPRPAVVGRARSHAAAAWRPGRGP